MARHRKMQVEDDTSPAMDISSLIDCCFLLLLYFIVCTSIGRELKLDMQMPGETSSASAPKTPLQPGKVTIDENGVISWGQQGGEQMEIDSDVNNHELPGLVQQLTDFKAKADSLGTKPIVQLSSSNSVHYQRFVDVMNAFAKAGIKDVGISGSEVD